MLHDLLRPEELEQHLFGSATNSPFVVSESQQDAPQVRYSQHGQPFHALRPDQHRPVVGEASQQDQGALFLEGDQELEGDLTHLVGGVF